MRAGAVAPLLALAVSALPQDGNPDATVFSFATPVILPVVDPSSVSPLVDPSPALSTTTCCDTTVRTLSTITIINSYTSTYAGTVGVVTYTSLIYGGSTSVVTETGYPTPTVSYGPTFSGGPPSPPGPSPTPCPESSYGPEVTYYTTVYTTEYDEICDTGYGKATYTITDQWSGPHGPRPTHYLPPGFTVTVTACDSCEDDSTTTLTVPCPPTTTWDYEPTTTPEPPYESTTICDDDTTTWEYEPTTTPEPSHSEPDYTTTTTTECPEETPDYPSPSSTPDEPSYTPEPTYSTDEPEYTTTTECPEETPDYPPYKPSHTPDEPSYSSYSTAEPTYSTEEPGYTEPPYYPSESATWDYTTHTLTVSEFCSTGLRPMTHTITESCKHKCTPKPEPYIPEGWTTTVTECKKCGPTPITATLTVTCHECQHTPEATPYDSSEPEEPSYYPILTSTLPVSVYGSEPEPTDPGHAGPPLPPPVKIFNNATYHMPSNVSTSAKATLQPTTETPADSAPTGPAAGGSDDSIPASAASVVSVSAAATVLVSLFLSLCFLRL